MKMRANSIIVLVSRKCHTNRSMPSRGITSYTAVAMKSFSHYRHNTLFTNVLSISSNKIEPHYTRAIAVLSR
jgi:hypothetical protein